MGEVPENIPNELSAYHEEFILVVQKEINESAIPFTIDLIGRLVKLPADVEGYGPSLEKEIVTMAGCVRKREFGEGYDPLIVQNKKARKKSGTEPKKANLIESKKKSVVEIVKEEEAECKVVRSIPDSAARRYQLEILEVAIRRNTVIILETGSGKTLISVLLMKQIAHELRAKGDKGLIVFLAPTIQLVVQQSDVIKYNTDLQVGYYYGTKGVDSWNVEKWKREIEINEVLVMTPQILLDGLRLSFLKLDMVDLLIFDECHHACGQHPYAKIMKEYYYGCQHKPKVFGMTASPVIRK
ncbi:hypothetical protein KI387_008715, partial [Taxus chinensis]